MIPSHFSFGDPKPYDDLLVPRIREDIYVCPCLFPPHPPGTVACECKAKENYFELKAAAAHFAAAYDEDDNTGSIDETEDEDEEDEMEGEEDEDDDDEEGDHDDEEYEDEDDDDDDDDDEVGEVEHSMLRDRSQYSVDVSQRLVQNLDSTCFFVLLALRRNSSSPPSRLLVSTVLTMPLERAIICTFPSFGARKAPVTCSWPT